MAYPSSRNLLKKYRMRPSKGLGQNFLADKHALNKILETADLKPCDIVLEVGPGLGVLTKELAQRVKKVITVEKDREMADILKKLVSEWGIKNIEIISRDILKINPEDLLHKEYKVIANLPYYITSPVIRKFLETETRPLFMVLMVQKEVAQRICSKPPDMNLLAVSVQFYADPKIAGYVSKKSFWPIPKVDSAIIKISPKELTRNIGTDDFFEVVKAGFSQPRKQLLNNLSKGLQLTKEEATAWLLENSLRPEQRAETLSIEDWLNLTNSYPHR